MRPKYFSAITAIAIYGVAHALPNTLPLPPIEQEGFRAVSNTNWERLGSSVTDIGDINGDGKADFAVASVPPWGAGPLIDVTYVVFDVDSVAEAGMLDFSRLNGTNGFRIEGPSRAFLGGSIAHCDFDGDGLEDLFLGASGLMIDNQRIGGAFLIYGRASPFPALIDISDMSSADGFRIVGDLQTNAAHTGASVGCAGDFDQDRYEDLLIAAPDVYTWNPDGMGSVYLVHGRAARPTSDLLLADLGQGIVERIDGAYGGESYAGTGAVLAGIGDVSADGIPDFAFNCSPAQGTIGCIIYGGNTLPEKSSVAALFPPMGSYIRAGKVGATEITAIGPAGDMNIDGIPDLIVGTYALPTIALIAYGRRGGYGTSLNLGELDSKSGWMITDRTASTHGANVTSASSGRDFDGDGVPDVLLGTYNGDNNLYGKYAYLVSTRTARMGFETSIQSLQSPSGMTICTTESSSGSLLATLLGDINGDGLADALIGDNEQGSTAGAAYVLFGDDAIFTGGFEDSIRRACQ